MDFDLSDTERMLVETTRRVVARDVDPVLAAHPADRALPKPAMLDLYRAIGRSATPAPACPRPTAGAGSPT